jgi:nucleotidyltransferase/DNA polymerase involved in DNA repair
MRQRVFDETKLTVSAGIAANKVGLWRLCLTSCVNRFLDAG